MNRTTTRYATPLHVAIALSTLAVLVADVSTPLGVAPWVFYLVPVALSLFAPRPLTPVLVAAASTVGLLLGYATLRHEMVGAASLAPIVNRAMGAAAMWGVAAVARSFIASKQRLAEQDWIRKGQRDLGLELQGDKEQRELGDGILRYLCAYLGAPVAALYRVDGRELRLVGAYALGADARERETIAVGEGLLGQAVASKKLLRVDEVPEGHLAISSALGESAPRHVVAVPASVDGEVVGVFELGLLRAPDESDLDLLGTVAEPIAIALRSAVDRARLRELLAETQRQAERLQVQQEELRVTNEELENQSRGLKESQTLLEAQQAELEQTNAQLEKQTAAIEEQRDELLRAQSELLARSEELARASQYKSEFLANMSHELRTPLNSALILAKLLADNKEGNLTAEQVKFASTIYSSGNDLLVLINDILDLARVEAGRLDMKPEALPLARVAETLDRTFRPVAEQKGIALAIERDPKAPDAVTTDPVRLQQILRNLLGNALKFTDRGEVSLRVSDAGAGRVAFAVTDTGPGIPSDKLDVIFEAFRQADGTTQRRHGGTGLGLTISRQLAHRLGGEITVTSVLGQGSTFTLTVPARMPERAEADEANGAPPPPVPARPPAPAPRRDAHLEAVHSARARADDLSSTAVDDDRDAVAPGDKIILVVEDDAAFAAILRDLAREHQFRCVVAPTAGDAIELAERFTPSAVLLDVHLPDGSGLSVLKALKDNAATRHIPVHVVSVADHAHQALELGAIGYAVKPVERERLVEAFHRLAERLERKLRRVLVVEDVAAQRESLVALLSAENVEIVSVATAAEALARLRESTFDCMVLDLKLSDATGFELLDKMASGESFSFPPVIVYTGQALTRDEEQRLRRHASSIIIKGARSPERLLDEVTLFLHQVEAQLPPDKQRMLRGVRNREAALEGRTILVVEDDVRNVFALSSVLEPKGAKLRIARNGREALDALRQATEGDAGPVDLVLMDIMMPEMDGITAMREIRRRPELRKLPIIALTAKTMPDDRAKCLDAGANDYIAKPLDVDKLVSLVKVWMPK